MMDKSAQIYGIRAVIEAIRADKTIDRIYIQKGLRGSLVKDLEQLIRKNDLRASYVPVEKLNKLCDKNHQGVLALISPVRFHQFESLVEETLEKVNDPLFLLLDNVSDVRNFGAIIRTAECAGVHGIVIQNKGAAPITADTIKTSAGAVFNLPIAKVAHLKDAVYYFKSSGVQVVGATEKTQDSIYDVNLTGPTAIIMGSEDVGISPSLLKLVDSKASLPMMGTIDSLNVSVASGIILYEAIRQRKMSY